MFSTTKQYDSIFIHNMISYRIDYQTFINVLFLKSTNSSFNHEKLLKVSKPCSIKYTCLEVKIK